MPLGDLSLCRCCCVVIPASLLAQGLHPLHLDAAHLQWLASQQARLQHRLYQRVNDAVARNRSYMFSKHVASNQQY